MTFKKIFCGVAVLLGVLSAHAAAAATLSLSPSGGSYLVGRTFTLGIYVSSPGAAMNAVQGTLTFPSDKLELLSLSKTNSIMNLWVQEPSFSNKDGTIALEGIVTNPGFQGAAGKVLAATFRVKSEGSAAISFSSGSVLANDGKGTNILTGTQGATVTLLAPGASLPATGGVTGNTGDLQKPAIASNPPIKDAEWYNLDTILFTWSLPAGTDGVSYAVSNDPGYVLPQVPQGPAPHALYNLSQFADGVWYFYLSLESNSIWSPVSVRMLKLDRTPPEPFVIVANGNHGSEFDPNPAFQWAAVDKTSGVAYYRVKIGDGDWFDPANIRQGSVYRLPTQSPTVSRLLTVRAYDRASNFRDASISFGFGGSCPTEWSWSSARCAITSLFMEWGWWWIATISVCLCLIGWLFYHLITWKRALHRELGNFEHELRRDLEQLKNQMNAGVKKETLTGTAKHLEEDVKEEIKKIDTL